VYFPIAFAVVVETLNIRMRRRALPPVELHERFTREDQ